MKGCGGEDARSFKNFGGSSTYDYRRNRCQWSFNWRHGRTVGNVWRVVITNIWEQSKVTPTDVLWALFWLCAFVGFLRVATRGKK